MKISSARMHFLFVWSKEEWKKEGKDYKGYKEFGELEGYFHCFDYGNGLTGKCMSKLLSLPNCLHSQ
jgi:hypothetical protein